MTFQRENRYIVVKIKDLDQDQEEGLRGVMYGYHIPTRECLVIESDWPEYEPAWRMIQARVEGATLSPAHIEDGEEVEVVGTLIIGEQGWDNAIELNPGPVMALADAHPKSAMPLMTVAQHERKVSALELKLANSDYAYDSSMDEVTRLVRELDVLLNGESGAAQQASLCDIVGQVASVVREQGAPLLSAPPAAGVPEGWKLVPVEPTAEMQAAGATAIRFETTPINKLFTGNAVYRAAISAAPTPPASEQQRAVVMPEREAYPDPDECSSNPEWWARQYSEAKGWNDCLTEFMDLNPHLAKGEGV